LEASERDRESAVSAVSAAKEEAAAAIAAAHAETRDARAEALALASAASSKTEEIAPLMTKIERLTVELSHAENLADTRRDELSSENAKRRELEAVLGHVRDECRTELQSMRVSLRETKDNARTELAAGWESIRAELSRAQEQIAAAANQEADRKAAAVLVELDAQLAQSRDEVKEQKRLLQIADAKLDAKEAAKEADKVSLFLSPVWATSLTSCFVYRFARMLKRNSRWKKFAGKLPRKVSWRGTQVCGTRWSFWSVNATPRSRRLPRNGWRLKQRRSSSKRRTVNTQRRWRSPRISS
jgi:DNA repair exonuclease SbcCD ATPase subunit